MKKYLLFVMVFALFIQTGCKASKDAELAESEDLDDIVLEVSIDDKVIIDRSENLADHVVELFGIDDAATIIFNDTALISVIMAHDKVFNDDTVELINDLVMEKDTGIKEVLVSNDEKTFFQIVEIIGDLLSGSPYDNHVSEITKMIEKNK